MKIVSDPHLTPDQWEGLKALRVRATMFPSIRRAVLAELIALDLAALRDGMPIITPAGRTALVRGSFRLWDAAA